MDNRIIQILSILGLSNKEAKLYTTLLKMGSSGAGGIAKETKIPRATTYQSLERLIEKGLVLKIDKENILLYMAEDPSKILQNLKKEEEKIERKKQIFESLMPELEKIQNNTKDIPKVMYYEGFLGYIELLEKSLQTGEKEILMISNSKYKKTTGDDELKLEKIIKYERTQFVKDRINKGIRLKMLTQNNEIGKKLISKDKDELRETRLIPENFGEVETIIISGDDIFLLTDNFPLIGVHIEERQLSILMKNFFNFLWNTSIKNAS